MESIGQESNVWTDWWGGLTPEIEIRMWDYYGGRHWISKYVPRYGKTIEAGCGLGRYNFYFSRFGIEMEGVDFSEPTIDFLNNWKKENGFDVAFTVGDVTDLPYQDNSLSGYVSLGVVEHFIEGPQRAIKEAHRVLRPGGIAIITTPSISWLVYLRNMRKNSRQIVKKMVGYKSKKTAPFFQYEYRPETLKNHVEKQKLKVTHYGGADLLYSFLMFGKFTDKYVRPGTIGNYIANNFENTSLRTWGSQSITISVKVADKMYCFLSGKQTATPESLEHFTVPISKDYYDSPLAKYYRRDKSNQPYFVGKYLISPPIKPPTTETCEISGRTYQSDELFEDFGFNKKVHPDLLMDPEVNIPLCNENLQPIWRNREK